MKKKTAILVDIDGTICDSRIPISYLNGEKEENNYEVYYRLIDLSIPLKDVIEDIYNQIQIILNTEKEVYIVFLTGRTAEKHVMYYTLDFLEKNFNFLFTDLRVKTDFYFRPINYHASSYEYKLDKFEILKNMYNFKHIYEDEFLNINMFNDGKQENCKIHWIKGEYNFALENQNERIDISDDIIIHSV